MVSLSWNWLNDYAICRHRMKLEQYFRFSTDLTIEFYSTIVCVVVYHFLIYLNLIISIFRKSSLPLEYRWRYSRSDSLIYSQSSCKSHWIFPTLLSHKVILPAAFQHFSSQNSVKCFLKTNMKSELIVNFYNIFSILIPTSFLTEFAFFSQSTFRRSWFWSLKIVICFIFYQHRVSICVCLVYTLQGSWMSIINCSIQLEIVFLLKYDLLGCSRLFSESSTTL